MGKGEVAQEGEKGEEGKEEEEKTQLAGRVSETHLDGDSGLLSMTALAKGESAGGARGLRDVAEEHSSLPLPRLLFHALVLCFPLTARQQLSLPVKVGPHSKSVWQVKGHLLNS